VGRLEIAGRCGFKDVELYPGGAREWDGREAGTRHAPGIQPADVAEPLEHGAAVVVLSRGVLERLQVCPETLAVLERKGIPGHRPAGRGHRPAVQRARGDAAVDGLVHSPRSSRPLMPHVL
jgi:hypothetical protein